MNQKKSNQWGLLVALGLTFLSRTLYWHLSGGLFRRNGTASVDGYLEAAQMVANGQFSELMTYRPTQLLYPILLSPISKFHLSEDIYIFWLHMALALLTTGMLFLVTRKTVGTTFAILSAIAFSVFPFPLPWFRWTFTETLYYPLLFIHTLALFNTLECKRGLFWMVLTSLLLFFTKLDGLPFLALSWAFVWMKYVSGWIGKKGAFALGSAIVLSIGSLTMFTVTNSSRAMKQIREHFHVSHGLWLSTHTTSNANAIEHNNAIELLERITPKICTDNTPPEFADLYMCKRDFTTREAWRILNDDPLRWLGASIIRLSSHLFPAIYHTRWSYAYRFYHLSLAILVTFGALFSLLFLPAKENETAKKVFWLGFTTLIVPMFYEADAELRFRIPSQLFWICLAPIGWAKLAERVRKQSGLVLISDEANKLS